MDRMSYKERMEVCRKIKLMLKGVNVFDQRKIFWYLLSRAVKGQGLAAYWLREEVFKFLNAETERIRKERLEGYKREGE
jgi:hypothetical protein